MFYTINIFGVVKNLLYTIIMGSVIYLLIIFVFLYELDNNPNIRNCVYFFLIIMIFDTIYILKILNDDIQQNINNSTQKKMMFDVSDINIVFNITTHNNSKNSIFLSA